MQDEGPAHHCASNRESDELPASATGATANVPINSVSISSSEENDVPTNSESIPSKKEWSRDLRREVYCAAADLMTQSSVYSDLLSKETGDSAWSHAAQNFQAPDLPPRLIEFPAVSVDDCESMAAVATRRENLLGTKSTF